MYTVLLTLDGSSLDEVAIDYAALLARAGEGQLVLVHAVQRTVGKVWNAPSEAEAIAQAAGRLEALAQRLRDTGLPVESHIYSGAADCAVCHEARLQHPGIVVVPAAAHAAVESGCGAVEAVLRLVPAPLLMLPSGSRSPQLPEPFGPILVPLDGSRLAEQALPAAAELARLLGLELLLQETIEPPWASGPADAGAYAEFEADDLLDDARDYLAGIASRLARGDVTARVQVDVGLPARVLDRIIRTRQPFAVALSSVRLSASEAEHLIQRSAVPVLMCPSVEAAAQAKLTAAAERVPSA